VQEGDEEEDDQEEADAAPEVGMRKSARTEQVDFKVREEERQVEKFERMRDQFSLFT
jgi:hypothetical protein